MVALVTFYRSKPIKTSDSGKRFYIEQFPLDVASQFVLRYPQPRLVYVRHPQDPDRLVPLASYHQQLLAEKANEAITMLTYLGASRIEVAYSNEISERAKADIELLFGLLVIRGEKRKRKATTVVFRSVGDGAPPRP